MRGRERRVLAVLILGYFVSLWPFFPTARYRLPVAPLLALGAAALLVALGRAARRGERRRAALGLLALGLALVPLAPGWTALPAAEETWQVVMHDASRAADAGDREALVAAAERAEPLLPGSPETPFRLADYFERIGDLDTALGLLLEADARLPRNRLVLQRIGLILEQRGELVRAAGAFAAAAAADTTRADPLRARARVLRALGDPAAGIADLREAARREPGRPEPRSNLASLLAETGQLDEARALLVDLTDRYPAYLPGWFNLALLEHNSGNRRAALAALARARAAAELGAEPGQLAQLERLVLLLEN
jgi:predicted Zn-dependent protease